MTAAHVAQLLESWAPRQYQESYDNSGFQVGSTSEDVRGILFCLDITEEVLDEALAKNCNMIVAHHPLLFTGLKKIVGNSYTERIVLKAIKHDVVLYAIHTNLDNLHNGVNAAIAQRIGLQDRQLLAPKEGLLYKLITYAPLPHAQNVLHALFAAGAGQIGNYTECSFTVAGQGSFKPNEYAHPNIGKAGGAREEVAEQRLEVLVEAHKTNHVIETLKEVHPYEEVAYDLIPLQNAHPLVGAGLVGCLPQALPIENFLAHLKQSMNCSVIRYTQTHKREIHKVAICGGSGSFLLPMAIAAGADAFITADFKYHQFFEAEGALMIADIGHYESEQFTPQLLKNFLTQKCPNIALHLTDTLTNPVKYFH